MFITKYFQVINLTMPSSWVALLLSFLITYMIVRVKFGKELAHFLGDAMFYFVIVWKFSVVLTDFKTILQFPLSVLYFNGGKVGVYLGVVAVILHVFFSFKKKRIMKEDVFGLLIGSIVTLSMYQVWVALFNTGPFGIRIVTVLTFLIFLLTVLLINQFKKMPKELIFLTIGLHLFISALQPAGIFQTSTIVMGIIGGILMIVMHKEKSNMEAKH